MPSRNVITSSRRVTSFDQVVKRLGLSPPEYAASRELKEWARRNKDIKYVPPKLLALWGFKVHVDVGEELLKELSEHAA